MKRIHAIILAGLAFAGMCNIDGANAAAPRPMVVNLDCTNGLKVVYRQDRAVVNGETEVANTITAHGKTWATSGGTKRWPSKGGDGIVTMQMAINGSDGRDMAAIAFNETEISQDTVRYIEVNTVTNHKRYESCVITSGR